ncbi:MAG: diguanylate cyclase [Thermodesulfobacteriota bacterium]
MEVLLLICEAVAVYLLVLLAHSLRHRFGLAHFYALIGGVTAIMSWITDAGVKVQVAGITFMVGSTVFYTAILLAVFVVYVFDGVRATRIAISTVIGVSLMVPLIAVVLNFQMRLAGGAPLGYVPTPSLRINLASVAATFLDLIFLAMAWEWLGLRLGQAALGLRAFLTLLGVMWLDVILFNTGAFAGTAGFWAIAQGTGLSRLIVCCFAAPVLWAYLAWQNRRWSTAIERRPVLAIIKEFAEIKVELGLAQQEIERRKKAEMELIASRRELERLAVTDELTGLANRRRFRERAEEEFRRAKRYGRPLSLAIMDLDGFKHINDQMGHQVGDEALQAVAAIAAGRVRQSDLLARVGGDEFALLLPETDDGPARALVERLRQAVVAADLTTSRGAVRLGLSLGVAALAPGQKTLDDLMRLADEAMYADKLSRRDQTC